MPPISPLTRGQVHGPPQNVLLLLLLLFEIAFQRVGIGHRLLADCKKGGRVGESNYIENGRGKCRRFQLDHTRKNTRGGHE